MAGGGGQDGLLRRRAVGRRPQTVPRQEAADQGLGKNYLRATQHRDLLSILPDGARVYEFHPWEKNIVHSPGYVGSDVPILDYLQRLERIGENPDDYASIWYYF